MPEKRKCTMCGRPLIWNQTNPICRKCYTTTADVRDAEFAKKVKECLIALEFTAFNADEPTFGSASIFPVPLKDNFLPPINAAISFLHSVLHNEQAKLYQLRQELQMLKFVSRTCKDAAVHAVDVTLTEAKMNTERCCVRIAQALRGILNSRLTK